MEEIYYIFICNHFIYYIAHNRRRIKNGEEFATNVARAFPNHKVKLINRLNTRNISENWHIFANSDVFIAPHGRYSYFNISITW